MSSFANERIPAESPPLLRRPNLPEGSLRPPQERSKEAPTYVGGAGRDEVQSTLRLGAAQLLQLLLQENPLNLQLGLHALGLSHLLTALLHGVPLAELVDPVQGWREQDIDFTWEGQNESIKQ